MDFLRINPPGQQPGIGGIFAGIGYIFGLFGAAALVAACRREK